MRFVSIAVFPMLPLLLAPHATALRQNMRIVNRYLAPDGYNRTTVVADGTFPGPLLIGRKRENFRINVINELKDSAMVRSTSIHWHGFFQKGTNWADGPAFVNQCPIAANHSFLYDFNIPDQAGTFWYHSHLSSQYCDGLRGAIVIYDPLDPYRLFYDVDDASTVITLSDWYHTPAPSAGKFPTPTSALINGLGRYNGGPASPLAVVNVRKGRRYRLRIVSLSCDPSYDFSIDGHSLTIIEADGGSTFPKRVDRLTILAGQRYSVILDAIQKRGNYWIRANPNIGPRGFENGINSAILRYNSAPNTDPTTTEKFADQITDLVETDLHAAKLPGTPGRPYPGGADVNINLDVAFNRTTLDFTVNGEHFTLPTVPVLLQILSGTQNPNDLLPKGGVIPLPRGKSVEVSMPGGVIAGGHPIHLHGHAFDVVRSAGSATYNYLNPVRRDVVNMGTTGDNVTIRFRTDNPGPWMLHCHIEWHLDAGFAVIFAEDIPNMKEANPVPQAWKDLCPIYDSLTPDQL